MQRGKSESYRAAVERLNGFVTGERPVPLAGVGDEILAVAWMLQSQPGLRRALSDPSRDGADRGGLLGSILHGKVGEDTEALLRLLVAGHWSTSTQLLSAVERLGVEALLASADSAGELAEVEDELFRFGQIVDANSDLASALGNSSAPAARRSELVHALLSGKASSATLHLADLAVRGFGGRSFSNALSRLVELAAERRDRQVAYVTVARPLTEDDENRLSARLGQIYGRAVALKVSVNPKILGGVRVRVGFDLYEGTVLRRLNETRVALAGRA
jgi:F-type H+-transporting ATPase subunit delta